MRSRCDTQPGRGDHRPVETVGAASLGPSPAPLGTDEALSLSERWRRASPVGKVWRTLLGIVVLGSFGVWIYAYSGFADRPPPDELDSTRAYLDAPDDPPAAFGPQAEPICAATIGALPDAADAGSASERADQLDEANASLAALLDELGDRVDGSVEDRQLLRSWLEDWRVLVEDRRRYARAVRSDPAAVFTVSRPAEGEALERRITRFARTNLMLSCGAPSDLG